MSTMQRMAPGIFGGDLAMYPSEDGKYVRLDDALAAIKNASRAAYQAHAVPAIPEGWQMVPVEQVKRVKQEPRPPAGQQDSGEKAVYAKCYVCDKPMDGTSEDDCHCFHRRELAATASEATAAQQEKLNILATFVHEIWMGAYPWSAASGKARIALERAGLLRLEDVVALSSAAPANGEGAG